jgi:hypothetical protein
MNQRVSELFETIRNAETELAEIRQKCTHPDFFVGMWSWRVGAYNPSRICNDCHTAIPGITDAEFKAEWDKFNAHRNSIG